jgi:hypothetical protein
MKFTRLLQLALGLACLSLLGLPLSGQLLAVGTSDSIPIGKLETMNDALQIAAREPISDLLKRLAKSPLWMGARWAKVQYFSPSPRATSLL